MRKLVAFVSISLDGFAASKDQGFDWIAYDEEVASYSQELIDLIDTAVYGRETYLGMYGYWSTVPLNPASTPDELHHAEWVENVEKIVFSTTLEKAEWKNSRLIKENVVAEVTKLKQQPGKNMMIFGSTKLVNSLAQLGLIDEYRINVNPVVLGGGTPLFADIRERVNLKLLQARTFDIGTVALHYETI